MKKPQLMLIIISAALLLSGCGTKAGPDTSPGGKLSVVASFYPMQDFALKIGGDKVSVTTLVPAGTEPHDWEPAAADIIALESADVFIYNGAGMEHWVGDVLKSLNNTSLVTVEAAKGIDLLEGQEHEDSAAAASDPHVWLNPMYTKAELLAIKDAFCGADPSNKSYYEDNFTKYAGELDVLDREFKEALTPLPNKDIVVAHEAFGYLCGAYGLNQVAIEGLSADAEPDPARMAEIIEFARAHNVKVIFFEELVSPAVAETIAEAIGAETDVLSPLEGLTDLQVQAGDDYFSVMRQNLKALVNALQ
jgi:zinc transport system substrate-binding protein